MNIINLLRIDLIKLSNYRAFRVLSVSYALLIISVPFGVAKYLEVLGLATKDIPQAALDPGKFTVLHFPDIWQNTIYIYTWIKIFMAILVIISVSNEFTYKTIRQNVIDGLSRADFLFSKLSMIFLLSAGYTLLVLATGIVTGIIYTPEYNFTDIFRGVEFIGAYFLDLFGYLVFALLLTLFIKKSGVTIFILMIYRLLEVTVIAALPEYMSFLENYFPLQAMSNMIQFPFSKYAGQSIVEYVVLDFVILTLIWIAIFIAASYGKLKSSDL